MNILKAGQREQGGGVVCNNKIDEIGGDSDGDEEGLCHLILSECDDEDECEEAEVDYAGTHVVTKTRR